MFNPSRRNRNIGTAKQGHGQQNKLNIPQRVAGLSYFESLGQYQKREVEINDHKFVFVIEETREGSLHACSIEDIQQIIAHIPINDYGDLRLIVLRQPKRKEEILSPVWGRLIYSFEFENDYCPAIILEAGEYPRKMKWETSLSVECQKELDRLKEDGHNFINNGKYWIADMEPENVRNTQLYRTLLHEFGHYVHYLTIVERPGLEDEDLALWEQRYNFYNTIPVVEKENLAHRYAANLRRQLEEMGVISRVKRNELLL
ncbi:hypothetical protein [Chitinophaga filiformis]|uniref:Uncharacterized protein n=1 Tax=Chitinophaga filiformis TaxID=104663 RepID=A0A1G7J1P2_CHIFI|nr:hypothetical protein [Chitinophaga filiformis]SDF18897.1 hypothetical protein SAMN04488121_1011071 [Chitinophaga filiformis]